MFVAIDRTSKFAYVELLPKAGKMAAAQFLRNLIAILPYAIHTVLTEPSLVRHWFEPNGGGIQFTNQDRHKYAFEPIFERTCRENGIDRRLTKIKHPWTNGQVERMNRTIKDATVKRYHYDDHRQLRQHLEDFFKAYNFARRLKTLKGLTPYEFICKIWTSEPERFTDLPPGRPSFMTRVWFVDSRRFRVGQARRVRSPQIAQAPGAFLRGFGSPAMNAA